MLATGSGQLPETACSAAGLGRGTLRDGWQVAATSGEAAVGGLSWEPHRTFNMALRKIIFDSKSLMYRQITMGLIQTRTG